MQRAFLSGRDVFIKLIVLTDSEKIARFRRPYGSCTSFRLPPARSSDYKGCHGNIVADLMIICETIPR